MDFEINILGASKLPYWKNNPVVVKGIEDLTAFKESDLLNIPMVMPFEIREKGGQWWQLPKEPVISLSCKNIIIRRNVAKKDSKSRRGTIKETWSQDDYEINIAGIFISNDGNYPSNDVLKLRNLCELQQSLEVNCPVFTLFNITSIAIESYDFPHTKGFENQMYTIKAYSDDVYNLLVDNTNV